MRVCYLADAPYVHTRRWVEYFARRGWETEVISFRPARIPGAVVRYVGGFEWLGKLRYLAHARRVARLVRDARPHLVHALHLTSYGYLAARSGVRPMLISVWGTDVLEAPGVSPVHEYFTRFALRRADYVTATGLHLASATLTYLPASKPVTVVPYGVDLDRFRPQPRPTRDEPVVGYVGRLSPEKGLATLLRALAALQGRGVRWRATLVGDGPERGALERLAARLGIADRVRFAGEASHDDVPSHLQAFDVFAMPSTWEGFGVAAVEAQAMELPVVASGVHGIPDVVAHGETGLLVPPGRPLALADALEALLTDRDRRVEMGRAGRRLVERRYDWRENAARMERIYRELATAF
ncbi:MAG TPA: glycosyltransferase [Dehalococcoidia bacterium]|nr:glycosyltransferase [Dehalococcoidia bacterium]